MKFSPLYIVMMICWLFAASCGKPADYDPDAGREETEQPQEPEESYPDPIGTYRFDGHEHGLYSALYREDDFAYHFLFSPFSQELGEELTTYFYFVLSKYFVGKNLDMAELWHNYDYWFIYEDPVSLYSHYRALQGGSALVTARGDGRFHVVLDIALADGTPLSVDYDGVFTRISE